MTLWQMLKYCVGIYPRPEPIEQPQVMYCYRASCRECPVCGDEHDDMVAWPARDGGSNVFGMICETSGNEFFVPVADDAISARHASGD